MLNRYVALLISIVLMLNSTAPHGCSEVVVRRLIGVMQIITAVLGLHKAGFPSF